ncbi:UNVERIFIED_CONTAM: hypothetical protein H355_011235 [Colinus virginianus]|nr:hypothetical protein H355_011235 [Colinus virginianus]
MEAKALELSAAGYIPVLLYEEALGFALSSSVRDKDGISAAAVFLQCAAALYEEGKQVQDMLLELRRLYGCFATKNSYFTCSSSGTVPQFFYALTHAGAERPEGEEVAAAAAAAAKRRRAAEEEEEGETKTREGQRGREEEAGGRRDAATAASSSSAVASAPCAYPTEIGPFKVTRVRDVARGYDSEAAGGSCSLPANEEMITFYLDNGAVITLRGSGTEPKLKYYAEACASTPQQGREILDQLIDAFIRDFIKPRSNLFLNVPL